MPQFTRPKRVIVTGGAGFIGSAVVRHLIAETDWQVWNVDKLTYAGNLESLREVRDSERYHFLQADICDAAAMQALFAEARPEAVIHLAAESHVDRSIDGPAAFVQTNVVGTYTLLEAARRHYQQLDAEQRQVFRFVHVSTDEVFGSLGPTGAFDESSPYHPRNPYSASKASSDHLARAWRYTYGLPLVVTNSSNNFGPYQFPEKLIPLVILNAIEEKSLPVYGDGEHIRDWIYVDDHARALRVVVEQGHVGATYNVGARVEKTNLEVVQAICAVLDELQPRAAGSYGDLVEFVADRPGHDQRCAINPAKLEEELGWRPRHAFDTGLRRTIQWYLENDWWWAPIRRQKYSGQRLGVRKQTSPAEPYPDKQR